MLRALVVLSVLVAGHAYAETIALLPLDGEKRLEIYGQPVASEVGRALENAGLDVVVVGAKMAVPDKAQLIVDGTIKAGKGDAISLSMRIRDPRDGTVLQTLPANAATLTTIDKAAAELSTRLVPAVRTHLAALAKPPAPAVADKPPVADTSPIADTPAAPAVQLPTVVTGVLSARTDAPALALLAHATAGELAPWAASHAHRAQVVDASRLTPASAADTVGGARARVGVVFEILGFSVDPGTVPLAKARVRVRIADGTRVKFDRVVVTDTIVGDRDITEGELAARTAREVLAIANAHLRRLITGWK